MKLVIKHAGIQISSKETFMNVYQVNCYEGCDVLHVFHDYHGISMNGIVHLEENDVVYLVADDKEDQHVESNS